MFGLSAASSALPSAQLELYQFKLQQARREAAQAQDHVRALEAQTNVARQGAIQAQEHVRTLEGPNRQAQPTVNAQGQVTGGLLDTTA